MTKYILALLTLCLSVATCFSEIITGSIRGRLIKENSPYIVTGDLIVNNFDTLRIDPGVELRFNENVSFLVFGKVIAQGTLADSLKFVPNDVTIQPGFWAGVNFDQANDSSSFKYLVISGATVGITFDQCNPQVSFSYFYKNLTAIDCLENSVPQIENNLFKSNLNAGIRVNNSNPQIINNKFYYNCESRVESVIVYNTNSAGMALQNILAFNSMSGFDCVDQAAPKIYHNTIVSNEFGISVQNSNPEIANNLVYMNQQGIVMENSAGTITFNDVYNNSSLDFYGVPAGVGVISTVNNAGAPCDQFYNISLEPYLKNVNQFNFEIYPTSPLIDAGDPQNLGKITYLGWAPDIGALESSYVLPVELVFFRYSDQKLEWSTASEKNNYGFNIWRSENVEMRNAERIGFVQGNGTTGENNFYSFIDPNPPDFDCYYQLEQIDLDGQSTLSKIIFVERSNIIQTPVVYSAYPNPFNAETNFSWYLPKTAKVTIKIYNVLGEEVVSFFQSEMMNAGKHHVVWNGRNTNGEMVASGIYYGIFQINRYKYRSPVLYVR